MATLQNRSARRVVLAAAACLVFGSLQPAFAAESGGRAGTRGTASKSGVGASARGGAARGVASRASGSTTGPRAQATARGRAIYRQGGSRTGHGHPSYYFGTHYGYGYPYYYPLYAAWSWPYWGYYGDPRTIVIDHRGGETAPAIVETRVRPRKAEILLDGEYVGQARDFNGRWDRLTVEPGLHTFELAHDGHMTLRRVVRVRPGGFVFLDERLRTGEGLDPRSDDLAQDRPEVRASLDRGPDDVSQPAAGSSLRQGLLRLEVAPPDAAVYLDGEFLARAGEIMRLHGALPVAQGPHRIEVVHPGYDGRSVEVEIGGEEPETIRITLARE